MKLVSLSLSELAKDWVEDHYSFAISIAYWATKHKPNSWLIINYWIYWKKLQDFQKWENNHIQF